MDNQTNSRTSEFNSELKLKGFKIYETSNGTGGHDYSRKDFYKISVTTGEFRFHYAEKTFETGETFLFFANPHVPYSCEVVSPSHQGYTCLFSEEFFKPSDRSESLLQSSLFRIGGTPIFKLTEDQKASTVSVFEKMMAEQDTAYAFKGDLIRNYINLITHGALKMEPSENYSPQKNAASRITAVFLELLERQFPIESVQRPLELRTAQDFANRLSVHVNYLNSSVKEVTGKPTTAHIAERIINEAKALLKHTDWNIAEIAYALGFHYPTYFNNFFKKRTGYIPKMERVSHL